MHSQTPLFACLLIGCASAPAAAPDNAHPHEHGHDQSKGLHHRFDDAEKWAERFDAPERDAWQQPSEVVTLCAIATGATVVDIGAGTGYFLKHLSQAVGDAGHVIALDVEENLVAYMTQRITQEGLANTVARKVDPNDPALPDGSTDRILIVDTWHHIDRRVDYATKLKAALVPGGRVIVVDFTKDSPEGPPVEHRIPPEQVVQELTSAGLVATVLETKLPRQYVVVGTNSAAP